MAAPVNVDSDHNFCFAVPESLESDRVLLVPFIPSKHAEPFISQAVHVPDLLAHLPFGPFRDVQHFVTEFIQPYHQKDSGFLLFAVYDKSQASGTSDSSSSSSPPHGTPTFAGIIALKESSVSHLKTEIGTVVILPEFQRTHVASNAVGLLLHYALDLPQAFDAADNDSRGSGHLKIPALALGLRRVSWAANSQNDASFRLAERLGFRKEGTLRWDRVMPKDRKAMGIGNGLAVRNGDARLDCVGRDTVLFSLCWDDWENGGRERVDAIMARK